MAFHQCLYCHALDLDTDGPGNDAAYRFSVIGETSVRWMLLSSLTHVLSISTLVLLLTHIFPAKERLFPGHNHSGGHGLRHRHFYSREIIWQPLQQLFPPYLLGRIESVHIGRGCLHADN